MTGRIQVGDVCTLRGPHGPRRVAVAYASRGGGGVGYEFVVRLLEDLGLPGWYAGDSLRGVPASDLTVVPEGR